MEPNPEEFTLLAMLTILIGGLISAILFMDTPITALTAIIAGTVTVYSIAIWFK